MVLAATRNDTEYTAIVTQLRSAWDDHDLRERGRGGKSFGKGRTVHFAEADTEWHAEQIAHSISGDAAELEVTWSFDPDGQALALTSDDVSSPELLVAVANRTLAQARSAAASAQQNRSGFFPPSNVSSSRKGKGKGRVSSVAEAIISGDSVLNDSRKGLAKEVQLELAVFRF